MVRFEADWKDQWGAEVLKNLWKRAGETGLAADSRNWKGEEEKGAAGKVQESDNSQQEKTVMVRDYGYGPRRSCVINGPDKTLPNSWVRNPLLYEPLFITLVDLVRNRRLGDLGGIETALFFPKTSLEDRESSEGRYLLEYTFALELFFLLLISSSEISSVLGNEKGRRIRDDLNRASAVLNDNQFQGIYRWGQMAGSLLVSRKAWQQEVYLEKEREKDREKEREKETRSQIDLRKFTFFPFRANGLMSFERGTLEFHTREDKVSELVLHPSGEESFAVPLPEGRGELYFFMDILEVLHGIKERPLHSPSLVSALVLRAEEELEYTCSGKEE